MESGLSEDDNFQDAFEDLSEDLHVTESRDTDENRTKIFDLELWKIAGQIEADDTKNVGFVLGFTGSKLSHLCNIYPRQPQERNYVMLKKWCEIVAEKYGHHNSRRYLAKSLSQANYKNISDNLEEDITTVQIPAELNTYLQDINFDQKPRDTVTYKVQINNYIQSQIHNEFTQKVDTHQLPASSGTNTKGQLETSYSGLSTVGGSEIFREKCMLKMLKDLKLEDFYPSKISLPMITEIEKSTNEELTEKSIPWRLLRKFMNLNYKGRQDDLNDLYESQEDDDIDDFEDDILEKSCIHLHPLDVFLLTFLCCDPVLQQELVSKMFFCRLAVPFMYRTRENKLIMSKWAFRKIVINRKKDEKWVEDDVLSQFVKTVSSIRIGHHSYSKSHTINEILSDQKHSTFFNRKSCISFETQKQIAEGMVEASWFIPSNSSSDKSSNIFTDMVLFLNLRGNCCEYKEELSTVSTISDVMIVHIDVKLLNDHKIVRELKYIHSFEKFIIYALECKKGDVSYKAEIKYFKSHFNVKEEKTKFLIIDCEISFLLVKRFRRQIKKFLSNQMTQRFSEVISNITFGDDGFSVDGYEMAKDLTDFIDKQLVIPGSILLPLQGSHWKRLCQYTKELYKSKSADEQLRIKNSIRTIEHEQFNLIDKSLILHKFEHICNNKKGKHENNFFIAWMKSFVDERLRTVHPDFESKYRNNLLKLRVATEKCNRADIDKYSKKLEECQIHSNAISYENLIRELGQAFLIQKAFRGVMHNRRTYHKFPSFVSKMLQNGYPFEIMDGDTGMVPVPWVHAVLCQLKEDIGDKSMYAISVLGIQSSGKSTLLNTMFGLDFAVSSGRCTRGVFMQLIKVTDPSLRCDYLLILDTEGIRASIYEQDRRSFENELATFAIGLGNITLLNIKGENTSEIEDFLQIAVHACLRLKMANKNIKMHQKCVFVHQNVCAHDAFVKLRDQRKTLRYKLDKMVKDAASHEDRSDLYSFNQLIGFDIEKDVWYFPDLWQGEPPMATVAVGYSAKVSSLTKHILDNIAQSKRTRYSVTQTMVRIDDIWRGILMDDFVFSFRNGLEIQAYREMESFYQRLTWEPECKVDEFISTIVSENIARCTNDDELELVRAEYLQQLSEKLTDIFSISKDEWKDFVSKNNFKHLIEQYMEGRTKQLENMETLLQQKGQTEIYRRCGCHEAFLHQKSKMETHMIELKNKANDLVTKCKTDELSDSDLENYFDDMWNTWMNGIKSAKEEQIMSIEKVIEKKMTDLFTAINPFVNTEIETTEIYRNKYRKMTRLVDSIDLSDIQNEHVTPVSSNDISQIADIMKCKRGALGTINVLMKKIDTYISSLKTEYLLCNESHVKQVFMYLTESFNTNNSQINNYFLMTSSLRAKLVVHVKMYITEVFTALNDEYKEKNDMKKQMQSKKRTFFEDFLSLVKDKTVEVRMANLFLSKIQPFIIKTVEEKLPADVVKMVIPDTFSTKYSLMIEIMRDLVRKSDFKEFRQYIDNSSVYALDWITNYMNEKLFHVITDGKNEYINTTETHIDRICTEIMKSVSYATDQVVDNTNKNTDNKTTTDQVVDITNQNDSNKNISAWSLYFEEHLSQSLTITKGTLRTDNNDEIKNFCNYKTLIVDGLEILIREIKGIFKSHNEQNVRWTESPYKRVFNKLWGCTKQCPFCKESCQKSADHVPREKHSCIQHRPPAVWGVRKVQSQVMTWMPCNCLVYSDDTFRCGASNFKCRKSGKCKGSDDSDTYHPYREYNTLISNWLIEPSALHEPPEYWIWFISRYKKELCEAYNYKECEDIQEWAKITESDALNSLTRISRSSEV